MISFDLSEEHQLIRDTMREFAASELRERSRAADEASSLPEGLLTASGELGLAISAIPESLGGAGLDRSPFTHALVLEELGHGCAALASAVMAPTLFVNPVLDFGTEAQRAELLPAFSRIGDCPGALAFHEPQFSFDPAAMQTVAEPKGDAFVLHGRKRLVAFGDRASHFLVIASRAGQRGLAGLDAFVVPRGASGLNVADEREKTLGFQALPSVALELQGVEVPAHRRLGGESGIDGARLVNSIRLGGAAMVVGLCRAITEFAIPYAKERMAFGEPIARKQAIAFMLADMYTEVESMRWLVWKAASQLEQGRDATRSTAIARDYVRRKAMRIADDGLQVFGGHGYIRDYPVEMWFRNTRTLTVIEGTAAL